MAELVSIKAADGHRMRAFSAMPAGRPRGGLVVVHEFLGLTPYIESVCDAYAADGYAVAAPSLYDRQDPAVVFERDPGAMAKAAEMRKRLDWDEVLRDVEAARTQVAKHGRCGVIGFCMGGSVAWLAASQPGFAAAVSYYGKDVPDWLDKKPACPVVLHFGETDELIPLSGVERVRAAFPALPVYVYPAGHAFDNPARGADPAIPELARQRSLALLRAHVG
ncbi:MAG: dienelactone hydrolase family protein [Beijerinckiaceae bacterium]